MKIKMWVTTKRADGTLAISEVSETDRSYIEFYWPSLVSDRQKELHIDVCDDEGNQLHRIHLKK